MKNEIRKYVHNAIIGIAVVSVLYVLFIIIFDENSILSILSSLSLKTWALILSLSLLNYFLRFYRWSKFIFFLNPKIEKLTFFQNLVIYLSGFAFTLTPGKAGETVRSFYLKNYKISYESSIGAFIAERLQDIIVIFLISLLCVPLLIENTFELKDSANNSSFIYALLILFLIFLFLLSKIEYKSKLKESVFQKIKEIYSKIKFLFAVEIFSYTFFLGFIAWVAEAFALYLIIEDIFPGHDLILISMGIYGLAVLAGSLTFLPGGIGGTEAIMIILLSLVGIDYISAFAITIICRAATLWFAILIGGISFFFIKEY